MNHLDIIYISGTLNSIDTITRWEQQNPDNYWRICVDIKSVMVDVCDE